MRRQQADRASDPLSPPLVETARRLHILLALFFRRAQLDRSAGGGPCGPLAPQRIEARRRLAEELRTLMHDDEKESNSCGDAKKCFE